VTLFLTNSCGEPEVLTHETIVEKLLPVKITEADIFSGTKILSFLNNEEKHIKESNALFLSGLDAFRNKKDFDSATIYFTKSLLKEPTAQTYYELGNLKMTQKKYDEALLAFNMAENLDYEPFSKILYNKACIYSLAEQKEESAQYIQYAIQAGYSNLEHLYKDDDLDNVRNHWSFEKAIKDGLKGVSNAENLYWLQFKKHFAQVHFPMELKTRMSYEEMGMGNQTISYDYEKYISEMRDELFSRDVGKTFFYHVAPFETKDYVALIYIIREEYMGDSYPLLYRMATYTHEGRLIDKTIIAGQKNMDSQLIKATIKKSGIVIKNYDLTYEKDVDEHGYYNNPVISQKQASETKLTISKEGKFVLMEQAFQNEEI
tara:strand:- start:94168 stop:95289 length:1122 start_codon:yes stop_codon:yes gene_type:complete